MSDQRRKDPYGRLMKREHIPKDNEFFKIEEYSWLNFKQEDLVTADNLRATVVSHDLHDPQILLKKVTVPKQFMSALRSPARPLYPVDLSDDYRKFVQETIQRKKSRNFDDDDTATIDFSEIATPPDLEDRMSRWKAKQKDASQTVAAGASTGTTPEAAPETTHEPSVEPVPSAPAGDPPQGAAAEETPRSFVRMRPASDVSQAARDKVLARLNEMTGGGVPDTLDAGALAEENGLEDEDEDEEGDGGSEHAHHDPRSVAGAELGAETASELTSIPQMPRPQDDESALADAFERGRLEGEESGRVEGHRLALEQFKEIHTALEQTVLHLNEMKQQVLGEGREIFLEMLKLTAEGLLRSQLRFSDQDLLKLFQSAVESVGTKHPITISAHPTTVSRLKSQLTSADLPFSSVEWRGDAQIPVGDFTFDSQEEVLRVSLRKRLEQHIENLSRGLFEGPGARSNAKGNESKEESAEQSDSTQDAHVDKGAG